MRYAIGVIRNIYARYHFAALAEVSSRSGSYLKLGAELRVFAKFLWILIKSLPVGMSWLFFRRSEQKAQLKRVLLNETIPPAQVFDDNIFSTESRTRPPRHSHVKAAVIIPVFNAYKDVVECVDRVAKNTRHPCTVILIDDKSTDPDIRPFLRHWVSENSPLFDIEYIENECNLGFVQTVNKGLELARERQLHAVILNTDAMVPENWLGRLLQPIVEEPSVASVTPMSNNAEILTVPEICSPQVLGQGDVDVLDKVAGQFIRRPQRQSIPTGVGFCMALNHRFISEIGVFDHEFGRGYGEELDWCLRAEVHGGKNICASNLFVEHRGGASFGAELKATLLAKSAKIIDKRYPKFNASVQNFIRTDPLASERFLLGLALAGHQSNGQHLPVIFAHKLGGGAEMYLQDRLKKEIETAGAAVVVRSGSGQHRWLLELCEKGIRHQIFVDRPDALRHILSAVPRKKIVYSCSVGDRCAIEIPDLIVSLASGPSDQIEVLFHDFLPVSPSYNLLGSDGKYHGPPLPNCTDPIHQYVDQSGRCYTLADWQEKWGRLLETADAVTAFSANSKDIVTQVWPHLRNKVQVVPHQMLYPVETCLPSHHPVSKMVGILGNIGPQKGARVLYNLSRSNGWERTLGFTLIGDISPDFPLGRKIKVHGKYQHSDITLLTKKYGINLWLIPSIWPETFSYVTHEALATGLPVCTFNIGAQAETVSSADNGYVLQCDGSNVLALVDELSGVFDHFYARQPPATKSVGFSAPERGPHTKVQVV